MCNQGVSRVFQVSFKKTLKVFQKVSCCMALIAASRAEGGLVSAIYKDKILKLKSPLVFSSRIYVMNDWLCFTRYLFRFTLSSNSLQVIFFHHLYEDFNYNNFFELPTQISARANTSKIWLFGIFQRKFKYWIFIHNILNIQFLSYLTKWVENWKWVFFLNFGSIENMVIWNNS